MKKIVTMLLMLSMLLMLLLGFSLVKAGVLASDDSRQTKPLLPVPSPKKPRRKDA